jgi:2',3'-cyclic-nucleotide 2'-phosphodiesterase (5'-nucleotidase family)
MKLAQEVDGIDVLLSGHTHHRVYEPAVVNDTIIFQSGCHGSFLGCLDLKVEGGTVVDFDYELIAVERGIAPDPEVQGLVDQALAPFQDELSEVVGRTATALNRYTVLEATMDTLLLQSLLDLTGAQMAFSNGWRYGAPGVPAKYGSNRESLDVDAIEALRRYLEKESPVEAELRGTVVAV